MKYLSVYGLLAIMFLLSGCPAQTQKPMDNGSYDVPSWLPGKWQEISNTGEKKDAYFLKKDAKKGNLVCQDMDKDGHAVDVKGRRIIMSDIGGTVFISVYDAGSSGSTEEGYYVYKFRKDNNKEFTLVPVKEHAFDYDVEPADIKKFLEQNKNDESTYETNDSVHYKKL